MCEAEATSGLGKSNVRTCSRNDNASGISVQQNGLDMWKQVKFKVKEGCEILGALSGMSFRPLGMDHPSAKIANKTKIL